MPRNKRKRSKRAQKQLAAQHAEEETTSEPVAEEEEASVAVKERAEKRRRKAKRLPQTSPSGSSSSGDSSSSSESGNESGSDDTEGRSGARPAAAAPTGLKFDDSSMVCSYKSLPVEVLVQAASTEGPTTLHYNMTLFYRPHRSNRKSGPSSDTGARPAPALFVTNLPGTATADDLANLFGDLGCGAVLRVEFGQLAGDGDSGLRYALLTFEQRKSMGVAMSLPVSEKTRYTWALSSAVSDSGVETWLQRFQAARPSTSEVMARADKYIQEFSEKEEQTEAELERRRGVADSDGFTLVTRKQTARASGQTRASNRRGRNRKKKPSKELKDFYRFQLRENKRSKLMELRERFEEDRKRIEALKSKRKFKVHSVE